MTNKFWFFVPAALLLTACDPQVNGASGVNYGEAPQAVVDVAAPYQNLKAVRVNPADGCYVYRHDGPVETTFLPLRTKNGRPICTQASEPDKKA